MQKVVEAGTAHCEIQRRSGCGKTGTYKITWKRPLLFIGCASRKSSLYHRRYGGNAIRATGGTVASLMMEKFMYDSISRPELEEHEERSIDSHARQ